MFFNEWNVLVVDDEPDVLAVTKLALRNVQVYGLPLKICTAKSKAEAIELLKKSLVLQGSSEPIVAVALVDVVMENDHAGLELCKYIREEAGGHSMQLFIRTGQPGTAPERSVIDDYDISGYFTKMELTEQKLYTLVKSGVRQWFSRWYALMTAESTNNLVRHSGSRKDFLENGIGWFGEPGPHEGEGVTGFIFDKDLIVSDYPDQIKPLYDRLNALTPVIKSSEGHKLAMDDMGNLLVKTVRTKTTADYIYVGESSMIMPRFLLDLTFKSGLVYSTLWKKITDEERRTASVKLMSIKNAKNSVKRKVQRHVVKKSIKKTDKKPIRKITRKAAKKKN